LDEAFRVPGTRFRFGWDAIVGLVPGAGDVVTGLMGAAIIFNANRFRVPKVVQLRMVANVALDLLFGTVPVAGDVADAFWKSNTRNMALLERYAGGAVRPGVGDWLFAWALIAVVATLAVVPILLLMWGAVVLFDRGLF
jgi:hypothetical protein